MLEPLSIADKQIGIDKPCFVIAEAGVNHGGDRAQALRLIDAAADAGADAVKFQTFRADRLASPCAPLAAYQDGCGNDQRDMLRRLELSESDHRALQTRCRERGVIFLSSAFDEPSLELLAQLEVVAFKLPSGELTNPGLLRLLARQAKPILVSTGMSDLAEVASAVATLRSAGDCRLALLHCVSRYPTPAEDANLRAMETLREAFDCPVGFSDHTVGIEIALAATALGANIVEKHFTLDKTAAGPDHALSLEPGELAAMIRGIRRVEKALGNGSKRPTAGEAEVAAVARKSLAAAYALPAGKILDESDLLAQRPGTGVSPTRLPEVIGRRLRSALREGELLRWEHCE